MKKQEIRQATIELILKELHKEVGICGHCGKKECAGKESNSRLPDKINTGLLCELFNQIDKRII